MLRRDFLKLSLVAALATQVPAIASVPVRPPHSIWATLKIDGWDKGQAESVLKEVSQSLTKKGYWVEVIEIRQHSDHFGSFMQAQVYHENEAKLKSPEGLIADYHDSYYDTIATVSDSVQQSHPDNLA